MYITKNINLARQKILNVFYENVKINKYWMIDLLCSRIILRQDELVHKIQSIKRI